MIVSRPSLSESSLIGMSIVFGAKSPSGPGHRLRRRRVILRIRAHRRADRRAVGRREVDADRAIADRRPRARDNDVGDGDTIFGRRERRRLELQHTFFVIRDVENCRRLSYPKTAPPVGVDNVRFTVSVGSTRLSSRIRTVNVLVAVSPLAQFSVPLVLV